MSCADRSTTRRVTRRASRSAISTTMARPTSSRRTMARIAFPSSWGAATRGLIGADLDGDGIPELVTGYRDGVTVRTLVGSGSARVRSHYDLGWSIAVTAGDFDGDGHLDLAALNSAYQLFLLR